MQKLLPLFLMWGSGEGSSATSHSPFPLKISTLPDPTAVMLASLQMWGQANPHACVHSIGNPRYSKPLHLDVTQMLLFNYILAHPISNFPKPLQHSSKSPSAEALTMHHMPETKRDEPVNIQASRAVSPLPPLYGLSDPPTELAFKARYHERHGTVEDRRTPG